MPVSSLLSLSDAQLTTIMAASRPLAPADRSAFLELLAQELNARQINGHELGDGALYRLVRELQRKVWDPPHLGQASGKYR